MDKTSESLGILKEQSRWIIQEIIEIKKDVKSLQAFKWKAMGAASLTAFLATILVEWIRR